MSKKNKSLSILMATTTVSTLGVGSAVTSFGAYTKEEADQAVKDKTGLERAVTDFIEATGVSYEILLSWIGDTSDSSKISAADKAQIKNWLDTNKHNGISYKTDSEGSIESVTVKDRTFTKDQIFALLKEGKNYMPPVVNNTGSGGFVTSTGSGSSSAASTTSNSTSTSSSSVATQSDVVVETTSKVTVAYKLDEIKANTEVNLEKMVESLKTTSTKEEAVTLDVGNAKWIIEKKDLDMTKVKDFSFNPSVATTEVRHTTTVIPQEVKKATEGKANVVLNFTEKQVKDSNGQIKNQELPFKAKVAVSVGTQYANKKMKVYYIVNGKSYDAGTVVVDKNGRVICSFGLIGDFVLVEETTAK